MYNIMNHKPTFPWGKTQEEKIVTSCEGRKNRSSSRLCTILINRDILALLRYNLRVLELAPAILERLGWGRKNDEEDFQQFHTTNVRRYYMCVCVCVCMH